MTASSISRAFFLASALSCAVFSLRCGQVDGDQGRLRDSDRLDASSDATGVDHPDGADRHLDSGSTDRPGLDVFVSHPDAGSADFGDPDSSCVEDWPTGTDSAVAPPPTSGARVAWVKTFPWNATAKGLVASRNRIAFTSTNAYWLLDTSGNLIAFDVDGGTMSICAPVLGPDDMLFFAGRLVTAVNPDGRVRWWLPLGPDITHGYETTFVRQLLLSPDGNDLYVTATDGFVRSVQTHGPVGRQNWSAFVGTQGIEPMPLGPGVGDTVYVNGAPWKTTGRLVGPSMQFGGTPVLPASVGFDGLLAYRFETSGGFRIRCFAMDQCGRPLREFTDSPSPIARIIGFDGVTYVENSGGTVSVRDPNGGLVLGPKPVEGRAFALNAAGQLLTISCVANHAAVHAYDQSLDEDWVIPLGTPCSQTTPVLNESGVVFVIRFTGSALELTAIDTGGPGLAPTAWPAPLHDSRGTNWLIP